MIDDFYELNQEVIMEVYRKPFTAEWYHNSAHKVDEVDIVNEVTEPWTGGIKISFNATIDMDGGRRTVMKIILDENG